MFEMIKGKIKSSVGESLGETLVALLIAALALTMLPAAMAAATKADLAARKESVYYDNPNGNTEYDNGVSVEEIIYDN